MKRKLKMKKNLKYLILASIDLAFILNIPMILRNATTLINYRYNILILGIFFIVNTMSIIKIESK